MYGQLFTILQYQAKVLGYLDFFVTLLWSASAPSVSTLFKHSVECRSPYETVFLVILSVFFESSGFMKKSPRQTQFEPSEGKAVTFSDVHGVDEAKDVRLFFSNSTFYINMVQELQDVVAFLKDPSAFASLGGKLPKGVLLTGFVFHQFYRNFADVFYQSTWNGKNLVGSCNCRRSRCSIFLCVWVSHSRCFFTPVDFASRSDFEEMFVGVGAKRVRELFEAARKKEPAIIFIDELDAVGGKRSSRDQQYMKQTLNQLLVEMDGFQQSEGVIVIAATNFPESLDQ